MAALIDYAELLATVRELIDGTGRAVVFKATGTTLSDADKPWAPSGSGVSTNANATFVPVSSAKELGLEIIDDSLLKRAREVCLAAPDAAVDLTTYSHIQDGSALWKIEWASVLKPGDTALLIAFGVSQ